MRPSHSVDYGLICLRDGYYHLFATSTGKTSDIADQLKELLPEAGLQDVDEISSVSELETPGSLICCIPTWNTGADEARSGTAWDDCIEKIPSMNF